MDDEGKFKCQHFDCSEEFKDQESLENHEENHSVIFICVHDGCPERFTDEGSLLQHTVIHTGLRLPVNSQPLDLSPRKRRHELSEGTAASSISSPRAAVIKYAPSRNLGIASSDTAAGAHSAPKKQDAIASNTVIQSDVETSAQPSDHLNMESISINVPSRPSVIRGKNQEKPEEEHCSPEKIARRTKSDLRMPMNVSPSTATTRSEPKDQVSESISNLSNVKGSVQPLDSSASVQSCSGTERNKNNQSSE